MDYSDKNGIPVRQAGGWPDGAPMCWLTKWSDANTEGPVVTLWRTGDVTEIVKQVRLIGPAQIPPPDDMPASHPCLFLKLGSNGNVMQWFIHFDITQLDGGA